MPRLLRPIAFVAGALIANACLSAQATHCTTDEQIFFNCKVRSGKLISVCASKNLSAESGYVQYRSGPLGRTELQYPATRLEGPEHFALESHRPYQAESELLHFSVGEHEYSVYQVHGADTIPHNTAGVLVSGPSIRAKGETSFSNLKCLPGRIERLGELSGSVPPAQ